MAEYLRMMKDHGRGLITTEFLEADEPGPVAEPCDEGVTIALEHCEVELSELTGFLADIQSKHEPGDAGMDGALAIRLHELLPVPRSLAGDHRLWTWLGACRYPEFVAHRWRNNGKTAMERYSGPSIRQAFARLWWMVEMTKQCKDGVPDYSITRQLLDVPAFQDFQEALFGRKCSRYELVLVAAVDCLSDRKLPARNSISVSYEKLRREVLKEFVCLLSTLVLESMSEDELRKELTQIKDVVAERYRQDA